MALVKKFSKINKPRAYVHKPTDCSYFIVTDHKGEKYLTLDTTGSNDRKIKGKVSQTVQFNKDAMIQLVKIINEEFNIRA